MIDSLHAARYRYRYCGPVRPGTGPQPGIWGPMVYSMWFFSLGPPQKCPSAVEMQPSDWLNSSSAEN